MNKRIISFLLVLVLALLVLPLTVFAAGGLSNFSKVKAYPAGQFTDVSDEWFAPHVQASYEYALVDGTTPTTFAPENNLTIAEAIKLAACLNSIYNTGASTLKNGEPLWYQPYVDYALANGIIQAPYPDYTVYATRAEMAVIFARALPDDALTPINSIDDNTIPDVSLNASYGAAIYKLYRAGILTGIDVGHTYKPNDNISRAETAAIVTRMANIGRKSFAISQDVMTPDTPDTPDTPVTPVTPDTPQTTKLTITAEPSAISVVKGAQAAVNFTVSSLEFDRIVPAIGDSAVASCTWGIPSGNTIPLTIIGLSGGTTAITVRLLDADQTIRAETTVNVTVTGGSAAATTAYFPGYYPVPDYGVYSGTTPNYINYDTLNASTFYTYKIADMTIDMDYAVDGYMSLLEQSGFLFEYSYTTPDGAVVFVFRNTANHLDVFFTDAKMNDVPSIILMVTPS